MNTALSACGACWPSYTKMCSFGDPAASHGRIVSPLRGIGLPCARDACKAVVEPRTRFARVRVDPKERWCAGPGNVAGRVTPDPTPWTVELLRIAERLEAKTTQTRWTDRTEVLLERDFVVGAYV